MDQCVFLFNSVIESFGQNNDPGGGAVYLSGTHVMQQCVVYGNVAFGAFGLGSGQRMSGGGICGDGDLSLWQCIVADNQALEFGAGI